MIQIDDSGWGSLLGGVMIGMYNTETKKFIAKLIPIKYFQGELFKKQKYKDEAIKIFLTSYVKLGDVDDIQICRGYVLDGLYKFLTGPGWTLKISRKEIVDPLQSLLEAKFAKHLIKCGVPKGSGGAHCLSFDDQLNWIKEDPKRIKYVKTGWNSWREKYGKKIS